MSGNSLSGASLSGVRTLLLPLFYRYRIRLLLGMAALVGVDFLQLVIPRLLKLAVDALAAGDTDQWGLGRLSLLVLLAAVGASLLRFCWRLLIVGFSRLLERDIRNRIYAHLLRLDRAFLEKHTAGDIMAHLSNDLQAVQMACGIGLVSAVDALVMSTAAVCFMIYIDPRLTLLALLPMPFLALATRLLTGRLHQRFNLVQEQFSLLTEFVRTTLVSIRLVKAYTMEGLRSRDFEQLGREYVRGNIQVAAVQGLLFPLATMVGNLGMLMVLYFGGSFAIRELISLGDFVAFITYLTMLVWPMMAIGWVASLAQRGLTSLARIERLLDAAPLLKDGGDILDPDPAPAIECRDLTFTYPGSDQPVLKGINLGFSSGIYGITGRTGSGKSTLVKLLVRLYPVPDRTLFFSGIDVNRLTLDSVRERIAYVGQEPVLFSETIYENIVCGGEDVQTDEVVAAAKAAAVHEDIMELADGYDTVIGERGVTLSGGQRQRLALARALVSDRPVLVIDDALAALDVETEHEVLKTIIAGGKDKLVLLVSQRVKLLSETDEIIVLEQGRVADRGRHRELLGRNRLYQVMDRKQRRTGGGGHA